MAEGTAAANGVTACTHGSAAPANPAHGKAADTPHFSTER
ncbi:hypothetical protein BXY39_1903 [Eilatimonas milleporae]|uniref:Uncharacterized protein n=1 Tax=Eilatimonas milleporae TaxID=911205 RepID=A0A3M0CEL8_9PROT|nr:hypothetical protein BXY39_1903 [Eilatimonas milleporae]